MGRKLLLLGMALVLILVLGVVGCGHSNSQNGNTAAPTQAQEQVLADPIKTDAGYVSGAMIGETGKEVHIYKGIPYAAPPVGDLRWKPPQPVAPWSGIRECTVYSVQAAQYVNPMMIAAYGEETPSSEDCLYLNVVTPAEKATDSLPVMVWFHGGGYAFSNANLAQYNNYALPQHGVVIVTVNQRLGVMGLLAHPLLDKESTNGVSGNYMFLDQIAALQWVQKNITAFGGDPGNVTIFGQSGGSGKTIIMMASPLAKGLFNRAICQSGYAWGIPLKSVEVMGEGLFAKLGVDKEQYPLSAARALPWEKIIEADGNNYMSWDLAVDGWFMPDTIGDIFKAGKQNVVPFITGTCRGELANMGSVLIQAYLHLLSGADKVNGKAYAYVFTHVPSKWKQEGCVAFHTLDLLYTFGAWNDQATTTAYYNSLAGLSGATQPDPGMTDVDEKLSETMMTMLAQFAKTGDPNVEGLVTWPAYEAAMDQYLDIGDTLQVKSGFSNIVPPPTMSGPEAVAIALSYIEAIISGDYAKAEAMGDAAMQAAAPAAALEKLWKDDIAMYGAFKSLGDVSMDLSTVAPSVKVPIIFDNAVVYFNGYINLWGEVVGIFTYEVIPTASNTPPN